jgi:hypothetical protein
MAEESPAINGQAAPLQPDNMGSVPQAYETMRENAARVLQLAPFEPIHSGRSLRQP